MIFVSTFKIIKMKQFLLLVGILFTTFSNTQTESIWTARTTSADNN